MGGFYGLPPLPPRPQVNGPMQYAPQGNVANGPVPVPGAAPFKQPLAPNLIDGINRFMQEYKAQRDAQKARYLNMGQTNLQNMMLGLPIDKMKTAKYLKKGGMDLDFEGAAATPGTPGQTINVPGSPGSPGQAPPTISIPASAGAPGTIGTPGWLQGPPLPGTPGQMPIDARSIMMPSGPATAGQMPIDPRTIQVPGNPGTPYQPGPQQSGIGQLLTSMGLRGPQINPNSPGMQWMNQMAALG